MSCEPIYRNPIKMVTIDIENIFSKNLAVHRYLIILIQICSIRFIEIPNKCCVLFNAWFLNTFTVNYVNVWF